MIEKLQNRLATGLITWLTASAGGRTSGPPTAPVYAANCIFPLGGEQETVPGWPATAEKFSILVQKVSETPQGWLCDLDFFAPELVGPYLIPGAPMLVMEGPKIVGEATIREVFYEPNHP